MTAKDRAPYNCMSLVEDTNSRIDTGEGRSLQEHMLHTSEHAENPPARMSLRTKRSWSEGAEMEELIGPKGNPPG